jgi:hypothetical protein
VTRPYDIPRQQKLDLTLDALNSLLRLWEMSEELRLAGRPRPFIPHKIIRPMRLVMEGLVEAAATMERTAPGWRERAWKNAHKA